MSGFTSSFTTSIAKRPALCPALWPAFLKTLSHRVKHMVKLQKHNSPLLMKLLMKLFFQKTALLVKLSCAKQGPNCSLLISPPRELVVPMAGDYSVGQYKAKSQGHASSQCRLFGTGEPPWLGSESCLPDQHSHNPQIIRTRR
jgi:hypothetical protein